ncbi:hypothetical protein ZWY2020_038968 [Hordeum vulgare]|nr:hypothetical protein ZWY2020_038968 [Hordeum vulgare]
MASSSAALKMAAMCVLVLFAGHLLMAAPASAAVPAPVCVPGNCPVCVEGACRFCVPGCSQCVICVQLCICDCNLETFECNGVCYNNCMLRTPLH